MMFPPKVRRWTTAAQSPNPNSRAFYDRKHAEGKRHTQAVIALGRRRANVLWALLRADRFYEAASPDPTGWFG
jgi:hypothetical protein